MSAPNATVPLDQYEALRSGSGCVELADWSSVTVVGSDRQTFLNNFSTNDVKRLAPGDNCEAFITNVKGKTVGHVLVTCREEELVLITVPGQAAALISHLERYVIREDVRLLDASGERAYLLVAGGEAARDAVEAISDCGSRIVDWGSVRAGRSSAPAGVEDDPARETAARNWLALGDGFTSLVESQPKDVPRAVAALAAGGAVVCGQLAFEALRIEAGLPLYGIDFDANTLPQEVGRDDQAISFTKGCYLGQETVARIDALGHVNQQLAGVQFSGDTVPEAGEKLTHDGTAVGRVTSATYSPQLKAPLALAMLRRGHNSPGTKLESPAGAGEVVALPLH